MYVTLDFGSANSGALLNPIGKGYNRSDLVHLHEQRGFTKQPTVFWIKKELLEKDLDTASDILRIYSCVFFESEYAENPNFIWCHTQTRDKIAIIAKDNNWVCFRYPKMVLYKKDTDLRIKGSDGRFYDLSHILTLFFFVIKKECLQRMRNGGWIEDEISWGVTVPGMAIWQDKARETMRKCAQKVFGTNLTLYSEPECALIGINIGKANFEHFVDGHYILVTDLGGGTADISVLQVIQNKETKRIKFKEIKATSKDKDATISIHAGGNDIDDYFHIFFCNTIAKGVNLPDDPTQLLWTDFQNDCPDGAMDFDWEWHNRIQYEPGEIWNEASIHFNPGRKYIAWLDEHYPKVADIALSKYGDFTLDKGELLDEVFKQVHDKILNELTEILANLKHNNIELDQVLFAGGLSLDFRLSKSIKELVQSNFKYAQFSETSKGAVIGAVQTGGNHVAVTDGLVERLARKTYYTDFVLEYDGNDEDFKKRLFGQQRKYYKKLDDNIWLTDDILEKAFQEQALMMRNCINYASQWISYIVPFCLRYSSASQKQHIKIFPVNRGNQTRTSVSVYSSDKNLMLFPGDSEDLFEEGTFDYDFGYNWEEAELVFDPISSNPVEGSAYFILNDANGRELHKFLIKNVTKKGL